MKNLIIALSVFFALGANAQAKKAVVKKAPVAVQQAAPAKLTNDDAAQKDVNDLNAFTPIKPGKQADLLGLFKTKRKMLDRVGDSPERKEVIYKSIEAKLEASLDGPTFEKIKANTALFQQLTH